MFPHAKYPSPTGLHAVALATTWIGSEKWTPQSRSPRLKTLRITTSLSISVVDLYNTTYVPKMTERSYLVTNKEIAPQTPPLNSLHKSSTSTAIRSINQQNYSKRIRFCSSRPISSVEGSACLRSTSETARKALTFALSRADFGLFHLVCFAAPAAL